MMLNTDTVRLAQVTDDYKQSGKTGGKELQPINLREGSQKMNE